MMQRSWSNNTNAYVKTGLRCSHMTWSHILTPCNPFEPQMCALIQTSLRIGEVWSNSSIGAFRMINDAKLWQVDNEDCAQIAGMHRQADLSLCGAHMQENTFVVHLMAVLFDNSKSRHSIVFIYGNTLGKDSVLDHSPPETPTKVRMTRNDITEKYTNENSTNKTKI